MIRTLPRIPLLLAGLLLAALAWAGTPSATAPAAPRYAIATDHSASRMNWLAGQLEAVGQGYTVETGAMGKAQAYANAVDVMLAEARRALAALPLDAATTLAPALRSDAQRARLETILAGMTVVDARWDARNGVYTVVGVLPVRDAQGVSALAVPAANPQPAEVPAEALTLMTPVPRGHTPQQAKGDFTGIIINCDKVLVTPCLFPRLLRFDGKELWGPGAVLTSKALAAGPARYAPNLATALDQKVAGERPLVLEAIGVGQQYYPVLNMDDVFLVLMQHKYHAVFDKLPVVITLGQR